MKTIVIEKELPDKEEELLVEHIYKWNPDIKATNNKNNLLIVGSPWIYFVTEESLSVFSWNEINGILQKTNKDDHLNDYQYTMQNPFDFFCSCNDFINRSWINSIKYYDEPEVVSSTRELFLITFEFKDHMFIHPDNILIADDHGPLPQWVIERTRNFYQFEGEEKKIGIYRHFDTSEYKYIKEYLEKEWKFN